MAVKAAAMAEAVVVVEVAMMEEAKVSGCWAYDVIDWCCRESEKHKAQYLPEGKLKSPQLSRKN
jgi:hypothetical protein